MCYPCCIAFQELFQGCRLLAVWTIQLVHAAKYLIRGVQECTFNSLVPFEVPLDDADEVVNIDIPFLEWLPELITLAMNVCESFQW
jgi:hypothetical protein